MTRAEVEYLKGVAEAVDGDDSGSWEDFNVTVSPSNVLALCNLWLAVDDAINNN